VKKAKAYLAPRRRLPRLRKSPPHNPLCDKEFQAVCGSWFKCWVWAIMRMPRQAPAAVTGRLVGKLKAQRQEEGEHALEKCLAIAQQLKVGRFILKIDGDGPVGAWLFSLASHRSPPSH